MGKCNCLLVFLLMGCLAFSQGQLEREHRIRKSQFPPLQMDLVVMGPDMKKIRYYKEVDSTKTTYSVKFKQDRLHYHIDYDAGGNLINSGFRVKEVDIPEDSYANMKAYLNATYEKVKIKRMWQQYPVHSIVPNENPLTSTFQNLMLPDNMYKLMVRGTSHGQRQDNELWFDAEGNFKRMRNTLPANFDHVLY